MPKLLIPILVAAALALAAGTPANADAPTKVTTQVTSRSGGTSTQRPPPAAGFFITHCLITLTIRTIVASPRRLLRTPWPPRSRIPTG